jgi:hypothetical protein
VLVVVVATFRHPVSEMIRQRRRPQGASIPFDEPDCLPGS